MGCCGISYLNRFPYNECSKEVKANLEMDLEEAKNRARQEGKALIIASTITEQNHINEILVNAGFVSDPLSKRPSGRGNSIRLWTYSVGGYIKRTSHGEI